MGLPKSTEFTLPNLFAVCSFDSAFNPHYESVRPEALAWITSYQFFLGKKQEHFVKSDIDSLAAFVYPRATRDDYRTCCDVINIVYVGDMLTDDQDDVQAMETGDIILKALASEECTETASPLYKCTIDVGKRLNAKNLPGFQCRLFEHYKAHLYALAREARLRARDETLLLEDYRVLRRDSSGVRICFDLIEFVLGIDLPGELFQDEAFQHVCRCGNDMISFSNDLYSYNMEQSLGHNNANAVTVIMKEYDIPLQEAIGHLGVIFRNLMKEYLESKKLIRSFGATIDEYVRAYTQHLDYWIIGNLEWSFRSGRYFTRDSKEVRKNGVVKLMSKSVWSED